MRVGKLYELSPNYRPSYDPSSDLFLMIGSKVIPVQVGRNRQPIPQGTFRNLNTGETLIINHPEEVFVPIGRLDSSSVSETQENNL